MGGMGFVLSSAANSAVQDRLNSNRNSGNSTSNTGTSGPYSEASSMIDERDGINEIMNFLYSNLFICLSILFLLIILLYLYRNHKKELFLFII
jgi:hypothetical protein